MTTDSESAKFSSALWAAVLWPVAMILLTALLLLLFVFELFEVIKWTDHSRQVISEAQLCRELVISTQNEVRGYLLTGDPIFTANYQSDQTRADGEFMKLQNLVRDNQEQFIGAQDLARAKNTWYEHAKTMISERLQNPVVNADWVRMGTTMMSDLSSRFDHFLQVEDDLRNTRLHAYQRMKLGLAYLGGGLALILSLTVFHVVRKQMLTLASTYASVRGTMEQRHAALARSEIDLEAQKERLRVTLTSIGDGVIVTDPAGRIVLLNHEAERLTGWPAAEALKQPFSSVYHVLDEKSRAAVKDVVGRANAERRVVTMKLHALLVSRAGAEWPIEDSAAPIFDAAGEGLGVVVVFHDATEIRRAEASLKAYSADLEKQVAERTLTLQQAVSDQQSFSYSVSHDLRAPLRAMQGFSQALLEDYGEKLDTDGRGYLERIRNAAERLDRLITDLLSYTRISREDVVLEPLDLQKITQDIIEHYPNLNPPVADVQIDGKLPQVLGREAPVAQVVSNLLDNAVKFVPAGTMPHIRLSSEERGSHVRLWIADNGIGVRPEDHERIFNMFIKVDDSARSTGTGMGLAIVKKAMQTMRGDVGVQSVNGTGSRFWLDFRRAT